MMAVTAHAKSWNPLAWRCLALLCCALLLNPGIPPVAAFCGTAPAAPLADAEADPSPTPMPEDDDSSDEVGEVSPSREARPGSRRRLTLLNVLRFSRVAHLPHHHDGQAGHPLPSCTPFERGVSLPLRC